MSRYRGRSVPKSCKVMATFPVASALVSSPLALLGTHDVDWMAFINIATKIGPSV